MQRDCRGVNVALLYFDAFSLQDLKSVGEAIVPRGFVRRFRSAEREKAYWAGRAVLAKILLTQSACCTVAPDPEYGFLQVLENGTPSKNIFANISHTTGTAVAVVGKTPVGIDIERKDRDGLRVMKRIATDREQKESTGLCRLSDATEISKPILLWSSKEAFSKALGLGMKFGFKRLEVDLSSGNRFVGKTNLKGPLRVQRPEISVFADGEFFITVCSEAGDSDLCFQVYRTREEFVRT